MSAGETVTQADLDAAADLIETYWCGADVNMMRLARDTRAGHSQGAFPRAFARHRAATELAIARVSDGHPRSEDYTNARLIAAAPELLQAAFAGWALLQSDPRYADSECKAMLAEAISKATGDTS